MASMRMDSSRTLVRWWAGFAVPPQHKARNSLLSTRQLQSFQLACSLSTLPSQQRWFVNTDYHRTAQRSGGAQQNADESEVTAFSFETPNRYSSMGCKEHSEATPHIIVVP